MWSVSESQIDLRVATTVVTYAAGDTRSAATVQGTAQLAAGDGSTALAVILDVTAAHPVSPTWPDQPADRGVLLGAGQVSPLRDVVQGVVVDGALTLHTTAARLGAGVDVVVHLVDPIDIAIGDTVEVLVDVAFRRAVSLAHSACHLSSLALDAAVAPLWTKPVERVDPLGHPAFDQIAIATSTLSPYRAVDVYRLGKSLRKKGFDAGSLEADLAGVASRHRELLDRWVAADVAIHVDAGDGTLSARRSWRCRLDGVDVEIACGGTHVDHSDVLDGVRSVLRLSPSRDELTMDTEVPSPVAAG